MTAKRTALLSRWSALKQDRANFFAHWQAIAAALLPHAGRFFTQERKGGHKFGSIYDNTATWAHGVLTSGLFTGLSSPAMPWVRMTTTDQEIAKAHDASLWLEEASTLLLATLGRSNFYRAAQHVYGEAGAFGTAAVVGVEHQERLVHFVPLTAGEYAIQTNWLDEPCVLFREFEMPAGTLARQFGIDALSPAARNSANKSPDTRIPVMHAIYERLDRNGEFLDGPAKRWESVYFEVSGSGDAVLRVGGYDHFPVMAPRWRSLPGESYGVSCPGMVALGDIRGLQHKHTAKAKGLNHLMDPALVADPSLKGHEMDTLPGGVTFASFIGGKPSIAPLYQVDFPVGEMQQDILGDHERIRRAFHVDLFMLLTGADRQKTAYETAQLVNEQLAILAPVLQSLDTEWLRPAVEFTFRRLLEVGALPPIPESLAGQNVEFEFMGPLSQAQRAVGANSIDRAVASLGGVASIKPDVLDNFDSDTWAREYFTAIGAPSRLLVDPRKRDELREARNRMMAEKERMAATQQLAMSVKDMAAAPTDTRNALTDALSGTA